MGNENQKKHKKFSDTITYAYLRKIKKWMFCPNCQDGKMTIDKKSTIWTCSNCGYTLSADEFEDDYVFWFCDECGTYLNIQEGFDRKATRHTCCICGYENDTTFDNVKGICSDCGTVIPDADSTLCGECKKARQEKAKAWLATARKVAGVVAAVAGTIYAVSQSTGDDDGTGYNYLPDESGDCRMRCANCGNTNENTLWDEGDTIYCSKCAHRTTVDTGEDDVVECPFCHKMRDRKAMYCRWCNDSTWKPSTQDEFEETDKILKDRGY